MKITIEWFAGKYPQFNVAVASAPDREPFITIKGCRLAASSKGPFVSWPSTKNESTGKYWQHVWASDPFAALVLAEAEKTKPSERAQQARPRQDVDDDIPF